MFNERFGQYQGAGNGFGSSVVDPKELMEAEQPVTGMGFSAEEPGEDEELWPGGPLVSHVVSWKKQFGEGNVFLSEIAGSMYVWRTINRYEYKAIVSVPNTDPLMREEMIAETCVLWHPASPAPFSYDNQATQKAGVPARLAELIMEASGFDRNTQTRAL